MASSSKKDKTYVHWTSEMDLTLSNILMEENGKGHKTPNGWKGVVFTTAINGMKEAHNINFTKEKIMARLKTWNKYYKEVSEMLATSGFGWDWENNKVKVDSEDVWANYVTAHPYVKHYRDKVIINWSVMGVLCGADKATGSFAATANETVDTYEVGSHGEESLAGDTSTAAGSSRQRKRKTTPNEDIARAISEMATSMKHAAVAIGKATPLETYENQVYAAVSQLTELTQIEKIKAIDLLGDSQKKFDRFMALPITMRTAWLHYQFYGDRM